MLRYLRQLLENCIQKKQACFFLEKIASVKKVVLGAPLKLILENLASRSMAPDMDIVKLILNIKCFEAINQTRTEKLKAIARIVSTESLISTQSMSCTVALNNAPQWSWSPSAPPELSGFPDEALLANAGFVSFVILQWHVEGKKLGRTVWNLSTFHAYVSYHVKCTEGFMHTRTRCHVESLIEALDHAKPGFEEPKKSGTKASFERVPEGFLEQFKLLIANEGSHREGMHATNRRKILREMENYALKY